MEKSIDSIGSCSLDAEFSTDFSDTSESLNFVSPSATRGDFTQGISERCRRTHQPLPLVPKIIMNQPIFENTSSTSRTTTAMFDVDSGKFYSSVDSQTKETSETYTNGSSEKYLNSKHIDLQSPAVVAHANKKPSYSALKLACCVNGYNNYTNYDSAERREINKSREASPIPPLMSISRQQRSNDRVYSNSVVTKKESPSSSLSLMKRYAEFNIHEKDITDNAASGLHHTQETKKSFIQQRVEKLYGTSNILTHPNNSSNGVKNHTPPVVVENKAQIEQIETSLDLPVLKHLRPEFRNRLTFVSSPKNIQTSHSPTTSESQEKGKVVDLKKEASTPITIEKINLIQDEESEKPAELKNGDMKNGNSHKTTATDANLKDGHYFLKLLSAEKTRILNMAEIAENQLLKKQSEENATVPEEVVGLILAAIGKARLLATKKFKQFEGLCHENVNPNEDGPQTLCDDLQGFWDMMMLQVDNLEVAFKEVQDCIENDWKKPQEPDPAPPKGSRLVKRPLTQSNTSKSKSNSEAAQKREDQRKKLIEMKRRQKAAIHNSEDELLSTCNENVEGSSTG